MNNNNAEKFIDVQREFLTQWRDMIKDRLESDTTSDLANQIANMWIKAGLKLMKMQDDALRHTREAHLQWVESYLKELEELATRDKD